MEGHPDPPGEKSMDSATRKCDNNIMTTVEPEETKTDNDNVMAEARDTTEPITPDNNPAVLPGTRPITPFEKMFVETFGPKVSENDNDGSSDDGVNKNDDAALSSSSSSDEDDENVDELVVPVKVSKVAPSSLTTSTYVIDFNFLYDEFKVKLVGEDHLKNELLKPST